MHASGSENNIAADSRLRYHERVGAALATGGGAGSSLFLEAATNSSSTSASSQQMAKMEAYRKKLAQLPTYQQYHGVYHQLEPPAIEFKTFGLRAQTNPPLTELKTGTSPSDSRHTSEQHHLPYSPARNTVAPFTSSSAQSAARFGMKPAHSFDSIPSPGRPPTHGGNLMHAKLADLREPPSKVRNHISSNISSIIRPQYVVDAQSNTISMYRQSKQRCFFISFFTFKKKQSHSYIFRGYFVRFEKSSNVRCCACVAITQHYISRTTSIHFFSHSSTRTAFLLSSAN